MNRCIIPSLSHARKVEDLNLIDTLRNHLDEALAVVEKISQDPLDDSGATPVEATATPLSAPELTELTELAELEAELEESAERLWTAEQQNDRLMNLFVALNQLHATLNPEQVLTATAEITLNLLGTEAYALIIKNPASSGYRVILVNQMAPESKFSGGEYRSGDPLVDSALSSGSVCIRKSEQSEAFAVAPLSLDGIVIGALVLTRLLAHKTEFEDQDVEFLEFLAIHVATALASSYFFASVDKNNPGDKRTAILQYLNETE